MLEIVIKNIEPVNEEIIPQIQNKLDSLTKPLGSLGKLETIVKRLGAIQNTTEPCVDKRTIAIFAADNGVVAQGISPSEQSITREVTINFTRGITGINVFANLNGADLHIVDVGVIGKLDSPKIQSSKIREGTWDISEGPAMTREEAKKAIQVGIDLVKKIKNDGYHLIGTGEMGVGNTTTSSAVAAAFTGISVNDLVGRGAGLDRQGYNHKIEIVKQALRVNAPNNEDPMDVLAKLGGFDIAALVGCYLGAAFYKIPIVIDGFISSVAALTAVKLQPIVKQYIFTSHGSAEPGASAIFKYLELEPILNLDMRLGEGTGAAIGFYIIQSAVAAFNEMGTFSDANIHGYDPVED